MTPAIPCTHAVRTLAHHGARQHQNASDPSITSADAFRSPERVSPEELERLGEEIATLAAQLHAGTYRLLVRLREFDEHAGWNCAGFLSCAQWLSWRTGIGPGAAREKVRVAHALARLPQVAAAMEQGELSFAKVRAITRVATPESEAELLEVARRGSAVQVEKVVRAWRVVDRLAEANRERARHEQRYLTLRLDEDGAYVLRGRLAPEVGALLERALAVASRALAGDAQPEATRVATQALAGDEQGQASGEATAERDRSTAEQRRADALGLLVELALRSAETSQETLAALRGADEYEAVVDRPAAARSEHEDVSRRDEATASDVAGATSPRARAVRLLARAGRVQVVLHVDAEALREGAGSGHAVLDNGVGVPAGTSRRLACDATRVVMTHDRTGCVLDVGRRTRGIPTPIRRALEHRDRACRFPGCTNLIVDAHHIQHWADGGSTRLDNLVLLCRRHHRAVHEEGYRLSRTDSGAFVVHRPDGRPLPPVPPPPVLAGDALHPDALGSVAASPRPSGDRLDLHWAIYTLYRPRTRDTAPSA